MQANLISLYLIIASLIFFILLGAFLLDGSTSKRNGMSWAVILIGTIFYPIVLPLSLIEISRKLLKQRYDASKQGSPSRNIG
jgi:hypothetical protein